MADILIVDDDVNLLRIFSRVLEKSGFHVDTCDNGDDAMTLASSRMFDLVIMDISMPGISGLEAVRTINYSNPNQKIVIFSAYTTDQAMKEELKALNVVDILQKPLSPAQLSDRVRELIT